MNYLKKMSIKLISIINLKLQNLFGDSASTNSFNGERKSRRDHIEFIFYVLIYLFNGSLPEVILKMNYQEQSYAKR